MSCVFSDSESGTLVLAAHMHESSTLALTVHMHESRTPVLAARMHELSTLVLAARMPMITIAIVRFWLGFWLPLSVIHTRQCVLPTAAA